MKLLKSASMPVVAISMAMALFGCGPDKDAQTLTEQSERINNELSEMAQANPALIAKAGAAYEEGAFTIDVTLSDSLFISSFITKPVFEYFTACEVKANLDKNLETTVNALAAKETPLTVKLTDVYGESCTHELTAATLKRMVKTPLTQLNFSEARDGVFAALEAGEEQFRPDAPIKSISSQFKGGFFDYTVEFADQKAYKGLNVANLKARALKVLEDRYKNLGPVEPIIKEMYKSLGIDGFHLIYTAGEGSQQLKTTILLSDL